MSRTMQASSRIRVALEAGAGASMGLWQMFPGSNVSRMLASAGPDWVVVDCEHGNIDDAAMHECVPAIAAAGVSPIVRLPDMQSWMIKRALDSGAHGILIPLLRTADEARAVVQAAKFPPQGQRGFGSPFSMDRFNPRPTMGQYLREANATLLTMVQIETREALDAVDAIAAVDGIDLLFVGPWDLGFSIGHPIVDGAPPRELEEAISSVLQAARAAGKKCGIYASTPTYAKTYADMGFDMISVGTDAHLLPAAAERALATAKAA